MTLLDPRGVTPTAEWPPGIYGTDASGGKFSAYPEIRRCGCGIVTVVPNGDVFSLEWAASFPLVGDIQTVPRAELFAIATLVNNLTHGSSIIVSDSLVNINLYKLGRNAALKSTNGDLWFQIFRQIDAKGLEITIHWIQGHLDKVTPKKWFPPEWVALNHAADFFANIAAEKVELPRHITSVVIYHMSLVKKVQKRLVRVIISRCPKTRKNNTPESVPRPELPSLQQLLGSTHHSIVCEPKGWRCRWCKSFCNPKAPTARNWLNAQCSQLQACYANGPVPIPLWYPLLIGKGIPHHSHDLYYLRGVTFCATCGAYATQKMKKLAQKCEPPTWNMKIARDKLLKQQKPPSLTYWPDDVSDKCSESD
jgi:hypothetical protein